MPVWHEKTRALRGSGDLLVIGITQEQHPQRCELFAQWKEIEWPILWDPFNLTSVTAVPVVNAVDEAGIVQDEPFDVRRFDEQFVAGFMSKPAPPQQERDKRASSRPTPAMGAIHALLAQRSDSQAPFESDTWARHLATLRAAANADQAPPAAAFQYGTALRMRFDSSHADPCDFQAALDWWMDALMRQPSQYIWRRRLQQWGPRLDKPYPFYDWVGTATEEIRARGEVPKSLQVQLSGAEIAKGTRSIPSPQGEAPHPDPKSEVPLDTAGLVRVTSSVALHTGVSSKRVREPAGSARVHLSLQALAPAHIDPLGGPVKLWIDLPEGWVTPRKLIEARAPRVGPIEGSQERSGPWLAEFEIRPPQPDLQGPPTSSLPATLRVQAFYPVCDREQGACQFLTQRITIPIRHPGSPQGKSD